MPRGPPPHKWDPPNPALPSPTRTPPPSTLAPRRATWEQGYGTAAVAAPCAAKFTLAGASSVFPSPARPSSPVGAADRGTWSPAAHPKATCHELSPPLIAAGKALPVDRPPPVPYARAKTPSRIPVSRWCCAVPGSAQTRAGTPTVPFAGDPVPPLPWGASPRAPIPRAGCPDEIAVIQSLFLC
ncbi:vegetative cell wall protein gp1-like [Panicum hallii]|uniref:vegetative cell wall protein gp1-like n=1 Tax=Panicum hallii TaxID=206008 RepID=UPI000DF4D250|nr:vegetative cell wall protein gp1-like [Panicum hallii]